MLHPSETLVFHILVKAVTAEINSICLWDRV